MALTLTALIVWWLGLVWLAVTTANPPQLNLAQLSAAQTILAVKVTDLASGHCRVLRSWSPGEPPREVRISNLRATFARNGGEYIVPLQLDPITADGTYRVVEMADRGLPPLVYPLSPEVELQLAAWQSPQH